jgi:hypothetical protein
LVVQALNSIDQFMARLHQSIRQRGGPGLSVQSHVLLAGRMDESVLRGALERLSHCYPMVTARQVPDGGRGWHWEPGTAKGCPLTVANLDTDDPAARWQYAERVMNTPMDGPDGSPVCFHLLRAPGGRDAVLLQWDHRLMDGMAGQLLLREVNRLCREPECAGGAEPSGDEVRQYVGRHGWRERLRAVLGMGRNLLLLRRPVRLSRECAAPPPVSTVRMVVRCLDEAQTTACLGRVKRLCGFVSPTPALLASAFRAVQRVAPGAGGWWRRVSTQAPINLRPPGAELPIFSNLQTYVDLNLPYGALGGRDELVRLLHRMVREQLRRAADLGFLTIAERLTRRPRRARLAVRGLSRALTFVYGYHGAVSLDTLCGIPVEHVYSGLVTTWVPPGLSFAVNQYRGRLNLMVSYVAEVIPEVLAEAFLDALVEDLVG